MAPKVNIQLTLVPVTLCVATLIFLLPDAHGDIADMQRRMREAMDTPDDGFLKVNVDLPSELNAPQRQTVPKTDQTQIPVQAPVQTNLPILDNSVQKTANGIFGQRVKIVTTRYPPGHVVTTMPSNVAGRAGGVAGAAGKMNIVTTGGPKVQQSNRASTPRLFTHVMQQQSGQQQLSFNQQLMQQSFLKGMQQQPMQQLPMQQQPMQQVMQQQPVQQLPLQQQGMQQLPLQQQPMQQQPMQQLPLQQQGMQQLPLQQQPMQQQPMQQLPLQQQGMQQQQQQSPQLQPSVQQVPMTQQSMQQLPVQQPLVQQQPSIGLSQAKQSNGVLQQQNQQKTVPHTVAHNVETTTAMPKIKCQKGLGEHKLIYRPDLEEKFDDVYGSSVRWRKECESPLDNHDLYYDQFQKAFEVHIDDSERVLDSKGNHCLPISQADDQVRDNGFSPTFKPIDDDEIIYGVSVYHDLRTKPEKTIRAFLVAPYGVDNLYCQVACKENPDYSLSLWGDMTHLQIMGSINSNCIWHLFTLSCSVPTTCTPVRMAMSRSMCGKPRNTFPVKSVGFVDKPTPLQYGVCTSTIFDFSDEKVGHFIEFVEVYLNYGVQKIILYDTYNVSLGMHKVLDHYVNLGVIEIIPWKIPKEVNSLYYFGQILQYNDCMYRYMDVIEYLGLFDLDDFFAPVIANTWGDLFTYLKEKMKLTNVGAHVFSWYAACKLPTQNVPTGVPTLNSDPRKSVNLILSTYKQAGDLEQANKQIVVPRGNVLTHVHYPYELLPDWTRYQHPMGLSIGLVYHYRFHSHKTCKKPNPYGIMLLCYHLDVVHARVAKVLYRTKIIEKPTFLNSTFLESPFERQKTFSHESFLDKLDKIRNGGTEQNRVTTRQSPVGIREEVGGGQEEEKKEQKKEELKTSPIPTVVTPHSSASQVLNIHITPLSVGYSNCRKYAFWIASFVVLILLVVIHRCKKRLGVPLRKFTSNTL